ncbi:FeoA family protein [Candidatus Parabeggiatoa sp. HSG14]|uniref:FeoA family protein n=1 Tax=Candidatus Parabeggiatoa sp. HSG14 TaxID=3055593 RepID=UPI0025A88FBB|nr:FeoA family protein [Thiotrichales bacterium HSG14]
MSISLRDMAVGDKGIVKALQKGNKGYRQKLLAMGLTPGTKFSVTRYAPMGDPVEINVRGFSLSLRKNEADTLLVERIEE